MLFLYKISANRMKCQISTSECIEKACIFYTERGRNSIKLNLFASLTSVPSFFIFGRRPKGSEPHIIPYHPKTIHKTIHKLYIFSA